MGGSAMKCYFDEEKDCPLSARGIYHIKDYCVACQLYEIRKVFDEFLKGFRKGLFEALGSEFFDDLKGKLIAEEAFAKEQWDKVVAGFNDLISACEVAEKFGCKGVCKGGGS